ncbi:MAG: hypothetical protein HYS81_02475 [Candidatus Aenigmatarchaeota archaeon]|nr:MAG: hypothetical protein HYS81_02475 [Candidatus Aenigmarchaeota archaeon]
MPLKFDAELLRYVALVLIGILLIVIGVGLFSVAGAVETQAPVAIPRATEFAPEVVPILQGIQGSAGTIRAAGIVIALVGLITLVSGIMSILEKRKSEQPPVWSYMTEQQSPTPSR